MQRSQLNRGPEDFGPVTSQHALRACKELPEKLTDYLLVSESVRVQMEKSIFRLLSVEDSLIRLTMRDSSGKNRQAEYDKDGRKIWEASNTHPHGESEES